MKFETLKTIILVFLITVSLFLTFGMWNYQPSVESLNDAAPEDISLNGSDESIRTLVEPKQIIFHWENEAYDTIPLVQRNFFQALQSWVLYDFETASIIGEEDEIQNYDIEAVFPTALPMKLLNSVFTFHSNEVEFPVWSFQKMYLTEDTELHGIKVEFLSIDEREKAVAYIQDRNSYEEFTEMISELDYRKLLTVELENEKTLYLPDGDIELPRRTMAFSKINANDLVDVLFSDPSIVRQSNYSNRGTTYFTDSSQMSVSQDESTIEYISPGAFNEYHEPLYAEDLLNKSISNINAYKGWTDVYKLVTMNTNESYIRYQMFFQGYPVFSRLAQIEQRWGQRLIEYKRPLFRSNNVLNENSVALPSSQMIWEYVQDNYNMEDVIDIRLGYHLEYDQDANIIILEPSWFIRQQFSRSWTPIQP